MTTKPNTAATETSRLENELMTRKIASVRQRTRLDMISDEFMKIGRQRLFGVQEPAKTAAPSPAGMRAAVTLDDAEKLAAEIAGALETPEGAQILKAAAETGAELGRQLFAENPAAAVELIKGAGELDPHAPGSMQMFLEKTGSAASTMASTASNLFKDVNWSRVGIGAGVGAAGGYLASTDPESTVRNTVMGATAGAGAAHAYGTKAVQELLHGKAPHGAGGAKRPKAPGAHKGAPGRKVHAPAVAKTIGEDEIRSLKDKLSTSKTQGEMMDHILGSTGGDSEKYQAMVGHLKADPAHKEFAEGLPLVMNGHVVNPVSEAELSPQSKTAQEEAALEAHLSKIASLTTQILGAGIPAATQLLRGDAQGVGDIVAPAIGGLIAARRNGMRGVLEGTASNFLLGNMVRNPKSYLSQGLGMIKDPSARNLAFRGLQMGAPAISDATVDSLVNFGNKL